MGSTNNNKPSRKRFPLLYPTPYTMFVLTAATLLNAVVYGLSSFAFVLSVITLVLASVFRRHIRKLRRITHTNYEADMQAAEGRLQRIRRMWNADVEEWYRHYFSIRQDRAAFFKALTAVFPAGYREEWYVVDMPTKCVGPGYRNDQDLQTFLYIDLPEDLDVPHHQLRFAISDTERKIIGELPDYNKQRITLLESDSQQSLRLYLANEAYEHLKETSDAPADAAA